MGRRLTPAGRIDRISAEDLTNLAVDDGSVPLNFGAVLFVEGGQAGSPSPERVLEVLRERVGRVPRLRQRLVHPPRGLGRPYWVDDPRFDVVEHVDVVHLDAAEDEARERVLALAAERVCRRVRLDRPPWSAAWVEGPADRAALVLVVHHVLADGLGGLAVLGALADGPADVALPPRGRALVAPAIPTAQPPRPERHPPAPPTRRDLARDVRRSLGQGLRALPERVRGGLRGLRELGLGTAGPRLAPATSLNRATGPHRHLSTARVPLREVVRVAHTRGCTVNDVVLTGVVGALVRLLHDRGEAPEALVVSVPISSRRSTTHDRLGNATGVTPVRVPAVPDPGTRLRVVSRITAGRRSGLRGSSAGPLGLAFRTLARLGAFHWFVDRQRLVTTFVTNVRGPASAVSFAGGRVVEVVPMAVNPGNVGVSFAVLSYAGGLVVTVVADADVVPEHGTLTTYLADELGALLRLRED